MTADRTSPAASVYVARSSLRLLVDPTYGPFFIGQMLATAGIWVHNIAAAIVVYELTRSAALVGAVSIAQFGPQLLLTPWFGAVADRGNRRKQLVYGRLTASAGSGLLAIWIFTVGIEGTSGALAVIIAALVVGIGFALGGPAMQALIPSLVRAGELPAAIAMSSAPFTLARAGGPAVGALIVTSAGPAAAFAVAALGSLAFAGLVVCIRIKEQVRDSSLDSSVRAGFVHIRNDRVILTLLIGTAAVGVGADPIITLSPAIASDLGGGARLVGALASSFGVGATMAFPTIGLVRRYVGLLGVAPVGLGLMAVGLAAVATADTAAVALVGAGVSGTGFTLGAVSLSTQIQQRSPDALRGRIMAVYMIAFAGSRPIAAGLHGGIADLGSVPSALAVTVSILLIGAYLVRPARLKDLIRRCDELS